MDQIQHRFVEANGLKLHVADIGEAGRPVVLFLHGFPEIWYSWRHQMIALAKSGYRAIAPDFRGYGLSQAPPEPEKGSMAHLVSDTFAILDALAISKVFVVAKDFGARPAYFLPLLHPERVSGVVTLGAPFVPATSSSALESMKYLPQGFYISRWREPGRAEGDFGRFDAKTVVRNVYILFSRSEIPIADDNQEVMDMVTPSTPLPSWFKEEDVEAYGDLYEKSGFLFPLHVPYRSLGETLDFPNSRVEAPALLIVGEKDYVLKFPGMGDYIRQEHSKAFVPNLETTYVPEGSHFVQEQFPDQVNELILAFLNKHS